MYVLRGNTESESVCARARVFSGGGGGGWVEGRGLRPRGRTGLHSHPNFSSAAALGFDSEKGDVGICRAA